MPINTSEENHQRFHGIGGAQAEPSLQSRGMPRSLIKQELASDKCQGWEFSHVTGRGFAGEKGVPPKDQQRTNEAQLGQLVQRLTKGSADLAVNADTFFKAALLANIPMKAKAVERFKRKNPTQSRQQIRFDPLLNRDQFDSLMRPCTNSTHNSNASRNVEIVERHSPSGTPSIHPSHPPPGSPFGKTCSTLQTSPSQARLTARSRSTLGSRLTGKTGASGMTDITQFSRLSEASRENRKLREENEKLMEMMESLKEGRSTGRSHSSMGSLGSGGSRKPRFGRRAVEDKALAAFVEGLKQRLYQKWSQVRDAFLAFDTDRSGSIDPRELGQALLKMGLATPEDISSGRIQALVRLIRMLRQYNRCLRTIANSCKVHMHGRVVLREVSMLS